MLNYHELRQQFKTAHKMPKKTLSKPQGALFIALAIIYLLLASFAFAKDTPKLTDKTGIMAVIGEAENQGIEGMAAVACAIRNRGNLNGVFGYDRALKQKNRPKWVDEQAKRAWELSKDPQFCYDLIKGADHWEAEETFGKPEWAKRMIKTAIINDHHFYRSKEAK